MAGSTVPYLGETLVLLGTACIAVPLFKKFGLGSVLGYLAAGLAIGPIASLVTDGENLGSVAELGIVLLLFLIGLELKPSLLWTMRRDIFGLGAAQVVFTAAVLGVPAYWLGFSVGQSVVIALALVLSSTAIAMQTLEDRGDRSRDYGRTSFSVLLFQDLAIVPLLALTSFLAPVDSQGPSGLEGLAITVGAVAALILIGRFALNPLFQLLARAQAREIMTAASLFVVLGAAWLMAQVGLSMALGAFIAGVMLAESAYRHQLEADLEPFRGLLMGLFFLSVGLTVNLTIVLQYWYIIFIAAPVIMVLKAVTLYALCRLLRCSHNDSVKTSLLLSQSGEFAFVVFSLGAGLLLLAPEDASLLTATVTLTMALSPLFTLLETKLVRPSTPDTMEEDFEEAGSDVLLIGFGRFGQIVAQVLLAKRINVTILEANAERIREAKKFGFRIYFGDGRRPDVLRSAGAHKAKICIICTDKKATTTAIVKTMQKTCAHVKILARSYDRGHTLELVGLGVHAEVRETLGSALELGMLSLEELGLDHNEAEAIMENVLERDLERLKIQKTQGFYAGLDIMHKAAPVQPEPLTRVRRKSLALTPETEAITEKADGVDFSEGKTAK